MGACVSLPKTTTSVPVSEPHKLIVSGATTKELKSDVPPVQSTVTKVQITEVTEMESLTTPMTDADTSSLNTHRNSHRHSHPTISLGSLMIDDDNHLLSTTSAALTQPNSRRSTYSEGKGRNTNSLSVYSPMISPKETSKSNNLTPKSASNASNVEPKECSNQQTNKANTNNTENPMTPICEQGEEKQESKLVSRVSYLNARRANKILTDEKTVDTEAAELESKAKVNQFPTFANAMLHALKRKKVAHTLPPSFAPNTSPVSNSLSPLTTLEVKSEFPLIRKSFSHAPFSAAPTQDNPIEYDKDVVRMMRECGRGIAIDVNILTKYHRCPVPYVDGVQNNRSGLRASMPTYTSRNSLKFPFGYLEKKDTIQSCSKLRCQHCFMDVIILDHARWHAQMSQSQLIHYPNLCYLRAMLTTSFGYRSYFCACTFIDCNELLRINHPDTNEEFPTAQTPSQIPTSSASSKITIINGQKVFWTCAGHQ